MHIAGYVCLLAGFLLALAGSGWCLAGIWRHKLPSRTSVNRIQRSLLVLLGAASVILVVALVRRDFSFAYVADYTDSALPWYYALTAFWAGQEGSFLFWTLCLAGCGVAWSLGRAGRSQTELAGSYFWLFFFGVQAFFLFMTIGVSNPFIQLSPPPADGGGLNPLLRHPGMVFHPPLLFLGYAGFTMPACAGLAAALAGQERVWLKLVRNWALFAWLMLSAGILLGAWWSYMELGWGGYWAWDPVENASLIPWLSSSVFLHTSMIGRRSQAMQRSNIFLAGLTLVLCFFATFLTRSGVLNSLHAFGSSQVGTPLLVLIVFSAGLTLLIAALTKPESLRPVSTMISQQGFVVLLTWLLLAIGLVILVGTMWPVLSRLWSDNAVGLEAGFYNRVCLPLFSLIFLLLLFCPWLGWKSWRGRPKMLTAVAALAAGCVIAFLAFGLREVLPVLAAALAIGCIVSLAVYQVLDRGARRQRSRWGTFGVHFGLALIALGISFSGPYQQVREVVLNQGESFTIQEYTLTFDGLRNYQTGSFQAHQARLSVDKQGVAHGSLSPERRHYLQFDQPFAEASTISGLGDELYATLLGFSHEGVIRLQVSVNPLVNWIWIGGTVLCLMGLLTIRRPSLPGDQAA